MNGLSFHEGFAPKGCNFSIDTHALTAAAGSQSVSPSILTSSFIFQALLFQCNTFVLCSIPMWGVMF
jgi:hypothetical protein